MADTRTTEQDLRSYLAPFVADDYIELLHLKDVENQRLRKTLRERNDQVVAQARHIERLIAEGDRAATPQTE